MKCPTLDEFVPCRHRQIGVDPASDGWSLFNPTVANIGGRLVGVVRSSNYRIVSGQYEMPAEDGGVIRTENVLVEFSDSLEPVRSKLIVGPSYPCTDYPVAGLEDCRLRATGRGVGVSATVRNAAPFDGRCRIATADLDLDAAVFSGLVVLDGLKNQEHEKNWMPFVGRRGWLYAASFDGCTVTVDEDSAIPGAWQLSKRRQAPPVAAEFRGGSQLVPFNGGHLGLIHEVRTEAGLRIYEHRFCWLDQALAVSKVSPRFVFQEPNSIEFAAGLAWHGRFLVASYGIRDAEAWLCRIEPEHAWEMLRAVEI